MKCPDHDLDMIQTETQWGQRWHCPEDDCTMVAWGGETSTPADKETRESRKLLHALFDPLWEGNHFNSRGEAYKWLAREMGRAEVHFGEMQLEELKEAKLHILELRMKVRDE